MNCAHIFFVGNTRPISHIPYYAKDARTLDVLIPVMSAVYLDYNATTPLSPQVSSAIASCLDSLWANPSSNYARGRAAKKAVDEARASLARLIGCTLDPAQCITFTSGGTEVIAHAIVSRSGFNTPIYLYFSLCSLITWLWTLPLPRARITAAACRTSSPPTSSTWQSSYRSSDGRSRDG